MKLTHALVTAGLFVLGSYGFYADAQTSQTIYNATTALATQASGSTVSGYTPDNPIGVMSIAPKSIDLFVYSNATTFPSKELGYSLKYIAPANMHADVYIFPVPEALKSKSHQEIVKTMTISTIDDIKQAERQGMYQDFRFIDQYLVKVNGSTQGRMYGTFIVNDMSASTAVYVTEYKGHLFKIRISQPNASYDRSIASLWDNFANRMFKFLRASHY